MSGFATHGYRIARVLQRVRDFLFERVGVDETAGHKRPLAIAGGRSVTSYPRAKPSFHLQSLSGSADWIAYANKKTDMNNVTHWSTADFLVG